MIVDWPIEHLPPAHPWIAPDYLTRPDQEATNGMARSIGQTGTRFKVTLEGIPVFDTATMRMFRSLLGEIEGRTNLVRFRLPDLYGLDGPFSLETKALRAQYPNGVPFSTGAFFLTGVGFKVSDRKGKISEAAALNARELMLDSVPAGIGGCYVSIEDLCYTVTRRLEGDSVRISPVLRRAVEADTVIDYAPRFVGRLVTDSPGYVALKNGRMGRHTLEFVEDLTRARAPYSPD